MTDPDIKKGLAGVVVERVVRRRLQRRLLEAGSSENLVDRLEVERLARVRSAGEREKLPVQV